MYSRVVPLYVHITCVLELFLFRSCYMCSRVVPLVHVTCVLELFLHRCVFYSSSLGACYMCSRVVPL